MHILYIDFETSGLDPNRAAPLDFAARLCVPEPGLQEIAAFDTGLMRPMAGADITDEALAVNGFKREDLHQGRESMEAAAEFLDWLDAHQGNEEGQVNPVMLAGHNVTFDEAFLRRWLAYAGLSHRMDRFHYRKLDVQSVAFAALCIPGKLRRSSLVEVAKHLGIPHEAHTAFGDVKAGLEVLRRLTRQAVAG